MYGGDSKGTIRTRGAHIPAEGLPGSEGVRLLRRERGLVGNRAWMARCTPLATGVRIGLSNQQRGIPCERFNSSVALGWNWPQPTTPTPVLVYSYSVEIDDFPDADQGRVSVPYCPKRQTVTNSVLCRKSAQVLISRC